jgi:ABC-type lipoprotein export system ATPase subunit
MKEFTVNRRCPVYRSYRAARVRSLFNVTEGQASEFSAVARLPIDEDDWSIGLIVGPSGSGKSTIAEKVYGRRGLHRGFDWGRGPIIDRIAPGEDFTAVTSALSAVGLGSCPSWLRPYRVLSVGEQFRAEMARLLLEGGERVCVDEFTSALDRQVARIAAGAFAKAWRRRGGRFVAVTCHGDVTEWLQPDWVFDTASFTLARRRLRRPPAIEIEIYRANWTAWKMFEPHHYLKLPPMACATNFVGCVGGEPVAHVAVGTTVGIKSARLCRLVVMPEWQGAGVGMRFLNCIAERHYRGLNRYRKRLTGIIHTSHPGLAAALRRDARWVLESARLLGQKLDRHTRSGRRRLAQGKKVPTYGGHLRSVLGFRYVGDRS